MFLLFIDVRKPVNHRPCQFLHRLHFVLDLIRLLILSKICLLIRPRLFFAGLINLHSGLFSKFSLWSLKIMNYKRARWRYLARSGLPEKLYLAGPLWIPATVLNGPPCINKVLPYHTIQNACASNNS